MCALHKVPVNQNSLRKCCQWMSQRGKPTLKRRMIFVIIRFRHIDLQSTRINYMEMVLFIVDYIIIICLNSMFSQIKCKPSVRIWQLCNGFFLGKHWCELKMWSTHSQFPEMPMLTRTLNIFKRNGYTHASMIHFLTVENGHYSDGENI